MRVALLGCGRIGKMHAANLVTHSHAELAMVYDIHRPSSEKVGELYDVAVCDRAQDAFESEDVDAVLVATATETHADYIVQSVESGKPVLCEKPIDLNLDRLNETAERIKNSNVPIQIGFNRRFDPGHRAARDAVLAGEIGDLHQVIITSRDPGMPPRAYYEAAGGLFRDMTIHDFDLARYMLNDEPTEVFATAGRLIAPELMHELDDYDTAMIVMRTADGKQCHINNSRTAVYGYDQRVELLGTEGMVLSDNRKMHEMKRFSTTQSEISQPYQSFFIERYTEAYMAELTSFISCLENDTTPEVGFEDGRQALVLAEAAYKSLSEGRIVQVSEITG